MNENFHIGVLELLLRHSRDHLAILILMFAILAQVIANGKIEADLPKIVEQLMEDAEDELLRHEELAGAGNSSSNLKFIQSVDGFPPVGSFPVPSDGNVGSVEVEILGDEFPSKAPHRVRAKIQPKNKDTFVFHIEDFQMPTTADSSVAVVTGMEEFSVSARPLGVEEFLQSVGKSLEVRNSARTFRRQDEAICGD